MSIRIESSSCPTMAHPGDRGEPYNDDSRLQTTWSGFRIGNYWCRGNPAWEGRLLGLSRSKSIRYHTRHSCKCRGDSPSASENPGYLGGHLLGLQEHRMILRIDRNDIHRIEKLGRRKDIDKGNLFTHFMSMADLLIILGIDAL